MPTEIDEQIIRLCNRNRKIEAIKLYMDYSKLGLRECKEYVDGLVADAARPKPFSITQNMDDQLIRLYRQGRKLEAIKMYKDATHCDLKTALAYVEQLNTHTSHPAQYESRDSQLDTMMEDTSDKRSFLQKLIAFFTGDKA